MAERAWVVMGSVGAYSDRSEWPAAVLLCDEAAARRYVDEASALARELYQRVREYDDGRENAELYWAEAQLEQFRPLARMDPRSEEHTSELQSQR